MSIKVGKDNSNKWERVKATVIYKEIIEFSSNHKSLVNHLLDGGVIRERFGTSGEGVGCFLDFEHLSDGIYNPKGDYVRDVIPTYDTETEYIPTTTHNTDGGATTFYDIPDWVINLDKLNSYLNTNTFEGNILKAIWGRLGDRHKGTNAERDFKKELHYAKELVEHLERLSN